MFARSILAITALIAVAPLGAQLSNKSDAAHQAADAREVPQTKALNNQVGTAVTQAQSAVAAQNDANQAQYEADKAAYQQALRDHHREVLSTDATFIRQQEAYAMAMRDWRAQVAECKKGYKSACDLPTPDPMKYM
ncbi:hypothetical protein [Rhizorhabdus argentea]|uniref:hypothetical protein n=1 Tax=Rhizorhabdus argentea TaxID=1387174 RepID=UPI0030EE2FA4